MSNKLSRADLSSSRRSPRSVAHRSRPSRAPVATQHRQPGTCSWLASRPQSSTLLEAETTMLVQWRHSNVQNETDWDRSCCLGASRTRVANCVQADGACSAASRMTCACMEKSATKRQASNLSSSRQVPVAAAESAQPVPLSIHRWHVLQLLLHMHAHWLCHVWTTAMKHAASSSAKVGALLSCCHGSSEVVGMHSKDSSRSRQRVSSRVVLLAVVLCAVFTTPCSAQAASGRMPLASGAMGASGASAVVPVVPKPCDRALSREARSAVAHRFLDHVHALKAELSPTCFAQPDLDLLLPHEDQKSRRTGLWTCGICGKKFKTEGYLDAHMDRKHNHTLEHAARPTCLADHCEMLRCPSWADQMRSAVSSKRQFTSSCVEEQMRVRRKQCEATLIGCVADVRTDESKKLLAKLNETLCKPMQCAWRARCYAKPALSDAEREGCDPIPPGKQKGMTFGSSAMILIVLLITLVVFFIIFALCACCDDLPPTPQPRPRAANDGHARGKRRGDSADALSGAAAERSAALRNRKQAPADARTHAEHEDTHEKHRNQGHEQYARAQPQFYQPQSQVQPHYQYHQAPPTTQTASGHTRPPHSPPRSTAVDLALLVDGVRAPPRL